MNKITTVIFDIGNVLMRFTWKDYVERLFGEETAAVLTWAIWRRHWWNELDREVLTPEEVIAGAQSEAPHLASQIREAVERSGEACYRHDYAIPWIESFKARGYRTLFLSNYSQYLMNKRPDVLDFLPHLEGGVFSYQVRMCKPEPAIYARICSDYGLIPSECLFMDDSRINVVMARKCGLNAIHFANYETTAPEIEKFLAERGEK